MLKERVPGGCAHACWGMRDWLGGHQAQKARVLKAAGMPKGLAPNALVL